MKEISKPPFEKKKQIGIKKLKKRQDIHQILDYTSITHSHSYFGGTRVVLENILWGKTTMRFLLSNQLKFMHLHGRIKRGLTSSLLSKRYLLVVFPILEIIISHTKIIMPIKTLILSVIVSRTMVALV